MATIVKRVVGALLALVGLALTAAGVWLAAELGSSGTAQFTVHPATADPVLIGPDVLNRVDADVVVTATPTGRRVGVDGAGEPLRRRRRRRRARSTSPSPGCRCATGRC